MLDKLSYVLSPSSSLAQSRFSLEESEAGFTVIFDAAIQSQRTGFSVRILIAVDRAKENCVAAVKLSCYMLVK